MDLPQAPSEAGTDTGTDTGRDEVQGADAEPEAEPDADLRQWLDEAADLLRGSGHVAPARPPTAGQVYRALRQAMPEQEFGPGLPLPAPDLPVADDTTAGWGGDGEPTHGGTGPQHVPDVVPEEDGGEFPPASAHAHRELADGGKHTYGMPIAHRVAHACGWRHS